VTQGGAAGLVTRGRATTAWRGRVAWLGPPSPGEEHPDAQEQRPQIQRRGERGLARGGAGGLA